MSIALKALWVGRIRAGCATRRRACVVGQVYGSGQVVVGVVGIPTRVPADPRTLGYGAKA
jgi:hypothetical protein